MSLRYFTAGDSHGPGLLGILEGLPAGLPLTPADLDRDLDRRQRGFGRSDRQRNRDRAEIWGGLSHGKTTGAPLGICLRNPGEAEAPDLLPAIRIPRPGHADLAGALFHRLSGELGPHVGAYALTNAHRRRVLFSCHLRELIHLSRLRVDAHAQWDIRALASEMCRQAAEAMPAAGAFLAGKDGWSATA